MRNSYLIQLYKRCPVQLFWSAHFFLSSFAPCGSTITCSMLTHLLFQQRCEQSISSGIVIHCSDSGRAIQEERLQSSKIYLLTLNRLKTWLYILVSNQTWNILSILLIFIVFLLKGNVILVAKYPSSFNQINCWWCWWELFSNI
jgi:hypothetical protein